MKRYRLMPQASTEFFNILDNVFAFRGKGAADRLGAELAHAFRLLASHPGIGHQKPEVTARPFYFFLSDSYYIVYRRNTDPLQIAMIAHASRDIATLLRAR